MNELANAFARNPRLPKFPKANVVVETIAQGIGRGLFVAELGGPTAAAGRGGARRRRGRSWRTGSYGWRRPWRRPRPP